MKSNKSGVVALAWSLAGLAALGLSVTQAQTVIPESVALPVSALDTSKPGFVVRVFQATGATLENTIARAENQIGGFLINPATGLPFDNIADLSLFNADGTYSEEMVVSYSSSFFPGIPGTESTTVNIALEAITYVGLEAGTYAMVVTSDDGAKISTGNVYDRASEIVLVESPSTAEKVCEFTITKAGVYPFRLVYEQGGGGYSVNWYTAEAGNTGNRVLLNDTGSGGLPCYRALKAGAVTTGPTVSATSPLPNALNVAPSAGMKATIRDGSTPLNVSSVKVFRNGVDVTAGATIGPKSGTLTPVAYKPATLPAPLATEEYKLIFDDPTAAGGTREAVFTFTIAPYANYTLPEPIWRETFDTVAEGQLPSGWTTVTPLTGTGVEDLADPNSDSYLVWVVISKQRVIDIGTAGKWNATYRLNTPEAYINGQRIESLVENQFAYHESDIRGGSQYAELFTPEVNLTGKTDIYLVYHSIYTQNQDNIAGVEYSINGGTTWLPVVYMIDKDDFVYTDQGVFDPEGTLNALHTDTADYVDPISGEFVGDTYGSFVKADQATWKDFTPYISPRINDDQFESKRIEKFRLPQADNQARVKVRFFQAGTASWFFGVDNVGLYSIPEATDAGTLGASLTAGKLVLTWTSGANLQSADSVTGPWTNVAASSPFEVDPVGAAKFYRLTQ